MKIALISPDKVGMKAMHRLLEADGHQVWSYEGGKSRMHAVAEEMQIDAMVVEGMCCDPSELAQVEQVTTDCPSIAVLLLCATHTPEFLINSMRAGVREVLPSPAPPAALQAAINRVQAKLKGKEPRVACKVLAFVSCKGGSGATFLATNLGYQLAESKSVLLIDLNLQFGDALSFVHEGKPASTIADVVSDIGRLDASLLAASTVAISPNYAILAAPEEPSQAMQVKPEHIEALLDLAVTQYDFVLLDIGRVLDTLSIRALDRCDQIFPVFQPNIPALRATVRFLQVCASLGYGAENLVPIANRFDTTSDISLEAMRKTLGVRRIETVANSFKEVNASINQGVALACGGRASVVTRNLAKFALTLVPTKPHAAGLFARWFKRA